MISDFKKDRLLRRLLGYARNRKKEKTLDLSPEGISKSSIHRQQHPGLPKLSHPKNLSEMQVAHATYQRERTARKLTKQPIPSQPPQGIPKLPKPKVLLEEDED